MAEITVWYQGDLSTRAVHGDNCAEIITDAPIDNQGLGRVFSPTDLVAVALGSCALTLMGMAAKRNQIDITGTKVVVTKEMQTTPARRIGKLRLEFFCPHVFSETLTQLLLQAAHHCPVHHSLHPEILQEFIFHWGVV